MLGNTKYITLEGAKGMMAAAEAEARKNNWNVAVAILDGGGHLLLFQKLDGTQPGSVKIAIGKATTALNFKRPTKMIEDLATTRPVCPTTPYRARLSASARAKPKLSPSKSLLAKCTTTSISTVGWCSP